MLLFLPISGYFKVIFLLQYQDQTNYDSFYMFTYNHHHYSNYNDHHYSRPSTAQASEIIGY